MGVTNSRALFARLLARDPNSHTRHQSTLDEYQFLVRLKFGSEVVHTASYHGKDALRCRLRGPKRWYDIDDGGTGWQDDEESENDSPEQVATQGLQWLLDLDLDWLVEEMHEVFEDGHASDDPRLDFSGDGRADARSLFDYVSQYSSSVRKDFDRSWKLAVEVSVFRASDQLVAQLVSSCRNNEYEGFVFTSSPVKSDAQGLNTLEFVTTLDPICDPADPSRARWILGLDLESVRVHLSGAEDEDEDDEGEEEGDNDDAEDYEDGDEERRTLGRDKFLRQLERLQWL